MTETERADRAAWDEIDARDDPDPHDRLAKLRDRALDDWPIIYLDDFSDDFLRKYEDEVDE